MPAKVGKIEEDEIIAMLLKEHVIEVKLEDEEIIKVIFKPIGIDTYAKIERDTEDEYDLNKEIFKACVIEPISLVKTKEDLPIGFINLVVRNILEKSFLAYNTKKD